MKCRITKFLTLGTMQTTLPITKVFAKAPGFPHWPGFITENAPDYVFSADKSKEDYFCVFFFDSWDYQLFKKTSSDVVEHVKNSKLTINWDENYDKFYKANKSRKKYVAALEQGQNWTNEEIYAKLSKVAQKRVAQDEKRKEAEEKKKIEKKPAVKKAVKRKTEIDSASSSKKPKTASPLDNLIKTRTYLHSRLFTHPNNTNISIDKIKEQLIMLRGLDVNFDILKSSKIGKMIKRISKLTEESTARDGPPKAQIKALTEGGVIQDCQNLVQHWTNILSTIDLRSTSRRV
eukprot:NODE_205_length_12934_cov_1.115933.p5 type:complete len:290 gc:universal NODE_205_length_12934_cov_1.115933:2739-3608(+)